MSTTLKPLLYARVSAHINLKRKRNAVVCTRSYQERRPVQPLLACVPSTSNNVGRIRRFPRCSLWHNISSSKLQNQTSSQLCQLSYHPYEYCARHMSYNANDIQERNPLLPSTITLTDLEFRVCELERAYQHQRLTNVVMKDQLWPILSDCASYSSSIISTQEVGKGRGVIKRNSSDKSIQQELFQRANLCNRILELCLKEVDSRRVFLWEWLQTLDDSETLLNNNDNTGNKKFSPTSFWNETPHPTKEMYTLVFNAYKNVIESCTSFSIKSIHAMELMESSAQSTSVLLSLMEDEYSSDAAFVNAYNAKIPRGEYTTLTVGATLPDVRNYSEVIATWGSCIDGSVTRLPKNERRRGGHHPKNNDASFQKRLHLEAAAMKSMMELLESMEEDLYNSFPFEAATTNDDMTVRKRPPPDRYCYNIILSSMARQINPSLYEMRLVLQRMMERVKYEFEHLSSEEDDDDLNDYAMSFFPDVFSYNALIEARANRSAMFASDKQQQQQQREQQYLSGFQRQSAWMQGQKQKRRFTSAEEEAILAEQTLLEMSHITTVSLRPNIWSYNCKFSYDHVQVLLFVLIMYTHETIQTPAVIKAWIKTDSERGLQRAVMLLQSLALNGRHVMKMNQKNEDGMSNEPKKRDMNDEEVPTVFKRIARWGASLLGNGKASDSEKNVDGSHDDEQHQTKTPHLAQSRYGSNQMEADKVPPRSSSKGRMAVSPSNRANRNNTQREQQQVLTSVGMASRLNYLYSAPIESKRNKNARIVNENKAKPKTERPYGDDMQMLLSMDPSTLDSRQRRLVRRHKERVEPCDSTDVSKEGSEQSKDGAKAVAVKSNDNGINSTTSATVEKQYREQDQLNGDVYEEPIGQMPDVEAGVTPDLKSFQLVVKALERRGNATSAQLASDLLLLLEECYFDLKPGISIYNSTMNAWVNACKEESADVRSRLEYAQQADELLCRLLGKDREESGMFPPPNESSFLMPINAWASVASSAISSGNVADGLTAAQHADELLTKLQHQPFKTNKMSIACYGAVIRIWSSLGKAERAQALLMQMIEKSELLPLDLIHFNAVFDAWASQLASVKDRDQIIPKLSSIHDVLMKMNSRGDHQSCYNVDPDTSSFNHVIRACYAPWSSSSKASDDESIRHQALDIAYDCYTKMSSDYNTPHKPDAHTYSHMFKAIACLLPSANIDSETHSEKYGLCKTILHDCCKEGHLTKSSLWIVRKMMHDDEFAELLLSEMGYGSKEKLLSIPEDSLYQYLPKEWSRRGGKERTLNSHRQ